MTTVAQDTGSSRHSALDSTPRSGKSHGGTASVTSLRPNIAREMVNEILECPIDVFLDHYAPFKPSNQFVANAFEDLKHNSRVNEVRNGDKTVSALADFTTPFEKKDTESTIFKRLEDITRVLEEVKVADGRERLFSYKDCPSKNITSEIDGTNFRVDACITSSPNVNPIILSDAAVVAEFKKGSNSEDIEDNRMKLISAAVQVMNDDPRRMWVYGITIEHTQMAIWYFCRSHSIKSASFDFTTDVNTFIGVFLSLLYATGPEIGYDPTVSRVNHKGKICYVYEVGTEEAPRYYRTTELIFAARVSCTTGRKTRVWKVVEVEGSEPERFGKRIPGTAPVVLKDGWLDEGASSEKDIQSRIFESLKAIQPSDYSWTDEYLLDVLSGAFQDEKYKEYFMEIVDSRLLAKTKLCHKSATPNADILSFALPKRTNSLHMRAGTMQSGDHSGTPVNTPSRTSGKKEFHPREYKTKQQHRLIYYHVGCSLSDAKDLSTSFHAIHDAFIALVLLYLAKWTHRDVSAGNIIVVESNGSVRGKLSDLEYAKEFSDETYSVDPKTGTPFFMPWEIHSSERVPSAYNRKRRVAKRRHDPFARSPSSTTNRERIGMNRRPMKFRFQHDLESLWWVALWILLFRVGGNKAHQLAEMIFTHSDTPSQDRTAFFTGNNDRLYDYIHEDLRFLTSVVFDIRDALIDSYTDEQKTKNLLNHEEYTTIYNEVWAEFSVLIGEAIEIQGVGFQNPKKTNKRPYPDSEPEGDDHTPHIPRKQCI